LAVNNLIRRRCDGLDRTTGAMEEFGLS